MVYDWMTSPGIVEHMMGPPAFLDVPVPSFAEFCEDWDPSFWTHRAPERGRLFLIEADGLRIGCIAHNDLVTTATGQRAVELDIWLAGPTVTGRGFGRRAIGALCGVLREDFAAQEAVLQPSARNLAACRCYAAAGFSRSGLSPHDAAAHFRTVPDYHDSVFYVRQLSALRSRT